MQKVKRFIEKYERTSENLVEEFELPNLNIMEVSDYVKTQNDPLLYNPIEINEKLQKYLQAKYNYEFSNQFDYYLACYAVD